jgi:autotransporter translocation and assembly factor TamB
LLLLLTLSLPFSEAGTRTLFHFVQRLAPLQVEHLDGSLASRLKLGRLAYISEKLRLELLDVSAQLDLECLLRSAFCFSELTVGTLDIDLVPLEEQGAVSDETSPETGDSGVMLVFPVRVESNRLIIARTSIRWRGGEWRQGSARLQVQLQDSEITVANAELASTELVLRSEGGTEPSATERIELPPVNLPFKLLVRSLSLSEPRWDFYGTALEHSRLSLAGKWLGSGLRLRELKATSGDLGTLSAAGEIDFDGDWPLRWSGQLEVNAEQSLPGFSDAPVAFELSGSPSTFAAHLASGGVREIQVRIESDLLDPQLPFATMLEIAAGQPLPLSELPGAPESLADLVLEFPWRVDASGTLERQHFAVEGLLSGPGYPHVALAATGERSGESFRLDKLSLFDPHGDNRLDAVGRMTLAEETVFSLSLETPGFNLPGLLPVAGRLQGGLAAELRHREGRWQVRLEEVALQGDINGLDASASGRLFLDQDWQLGDSDLAVSTVGADLRMVGAAGGDGLLELMIDDIGRWRPGSRGRVGLQGRINPALQLLELQGAFEDFEWGELAVERGRLAGTYAMEDNRFDLSMQAELLAAASAKLTGFSFSASGDRRQQTARLVSAGDIQGELVLSGTGWGRVWRGSLSPVRLETPHGAWETERSVALQWKAAAAQLEVESHCWGFDTASLCFEDLRLGASGGIDLVVSGDLANLGSLLPVDMEISGSTELFLNGSWEETGKLLFEGRSQTRSAAVTRHYGEGESATVSWDRGEGYLRFDGSEALVQWSAHRQGKRILDLDLQLPIAREQPLGGRVTVSKLQLEPLIAFFPALSKLQGELSGQFALAGTRDQPIATGELRLSSGAAALAGNPTRLEGLQLVVRLQGERAEVVGSGSLGGGEVRLNGELGLQPEWKLQLEIEGKRQNVLYPPATELLLSERLTLIAGSGLLSLTGVVTVHEGTLEPEELPEGSVAVSPHIVEVDYQGNVVRKQSPFDISLNVRVLVEDRFKVRTSVLVATLGGTLEIIQSPGQPLQLFGTMRIVDGYVSAYQQTLQVQVGTFSFTGRPDNPSVTVSGVRNISGSNVTVGIKLQGTYEALSIEVFSEPAMSDGEALSYLVRGRGLDSSAGEDGTALALSVASGALNRSALVSELNRIPGVNNVSFGSEGSEEDTAATVSGFIADRIYLSYGVGVYEPINVLIARLYLRTRLWLEAVSRLENSVDLYYAFDID